MDASAKWQLDVTRGMLLLLSLVCVQVLFATDVLAEAEAAAAAGWRAVLVSRPGNKPLPEQPGFRVIESMQQLLSS